MTDIMIYIKALQKVHGELTELVISKINGERICIDFRLSRDCPCVHLWIFGVDDHGQAMEQTNAYFAHRDLDHNLKNVADFKQRAETLINTYLKG